MGGGGHTHPVIGSKLWMGKASATSFKGKESFWHCINTARVHFVQSWSLHGRTASGTPQPFLPCADTAQALQGHFLRAAGRECTYRSRFHSFVLRNLFNRQFAVFIHLKALNPAFDGPCRWRRQSSRNAEAWDMVRSSRWSSDEV